MKFLIFIRNMLIGAIIVMATVAAISHTHPPVKPVNHCGAPYVEIIENLDHIKVFIKDCNGTSYQYRFQRGSRV